MEDMLSQAEIDALLSGVTAAAESAVKNDNMAQYLLSPQEMDAIGEIGNISMGTSATTLFTLLGQKVLITTPKVSITTWDELSSSCNVPYVLVKVEFTGGLLGTNLLILKEDDVKIITDLMMGGDGTIIEGPLSELHLSAISEAMNQMIGSSATSISSMFKKRIEISPPQAQLLDFGSGLPFEEFGHEEMMVKTAFRMEIGSIVDSEIMQLIPLKFAKELVQNLLNADMEGKETLQEIPEQTPRQRVQEMNSQPAHNEMQQQSNLFTQQGSPVQQGTFAQQGHNTRQGTPAQQGNPSQQWGWDSGGIGNTYQQPFNQQNQQSQQYQQTGMQPQTQPNMQGYGYEEQQTGFNQPIQQRSNQRHQVSVQPIQFQNFEDNRLTGEMSNISMLMDVPLQVTVELGRTHKLIREILELGPGSVIELDKLAGEPVDILVNGKAVAKGEVVVIDESFGVRITDIIHPSKRL